MVVELGLTTGKLVLSGQIDEVVDTIKTNIRHNMRPPLLSIASFGEGGRRFWQPMVSLQGELSHARSISESEIRAPHQGRHPMETDR
jgi:hypothetical protein